MNWEAISSIGEIIGATGVIVTLIYLAIQVRANTAATQASSRLDVSRDYRQVASITQDLTNARAFRNGLRHYPNIDYDQRILFSGVIGNETVFFQGVFAQYETGQLEHETYEAYLAWLASLIITPGGSAWWEDMARPVFMARMIVAVDERVSKGGLPEVLEMANFKE